MRSVGSTCLATAAGDDRRVDRICIEAALRTRRAGRALPIVIGLDRRGHKPDADLIAMVADARRWASELLTGAAASVGEIERREATAKGAISRVLPLAFLAPTSRTRS